MKRLLCLAFVLAVSCGRKTDPVVPDVPSKSLQDEINRMLPLLNWCDGQPSGSGSNNVDHRPNCDVGDGAVESGFLTLVGQFSNRQSIFNAMTLSFGSDNQPFRAPSYVGKDGSNEFSRDQLLGFVMATAAGLPAKDGLDRIMDYYDKTGALCPHPTDNRCRLTPGLRVDVKYAQGLSVTSAEKIVEAAETRIEAETVPMTYQADLVIKKIYALAKMKKLTLTHANSAKTIYEKAPNNLWFRTVYGITNKGTPEFFASIADSLTNCMKQWQTPGSDWMFSKGNTECFVGSSYGVYGHELVALGYLLLNAPTPVTGIEDDTKQVGTYIKHLSRPF